MPLVAARRVADLMVEYAGGTFDAELGGSLGEALASTAIALPAGFVEGLIGVDYTPEQIAGALRLIGATSTSGPSGWIVTTPTLAPRPHRQVDARRGGRPHRGYDRIPSVLPLAAVGPRPHRGTAGRRRVANALAAAGFVETPSFAFTTEEQNDLHGSASGARCRASSSRIRSTVRRRSCGAR